MVEGIGTGAARTSNPTSHQVSDNLRVGMPNCGQMVMPEQNLFVLVPDQISTAGDVPPEDVGHAIRVEITCAHNGRVS